MASVFTNHGVKQLLTKSGLKSVDDVLKGKKYVMLYFSAHWCPPCRGFTPELTKFYNFMVENKRQDDFELVFISSDKDEGQFTEYYDTMTFCALPFAEREAKAAIAKQFKCNGIPYLVITDAEGTLITDEGRSGVMQGKENEYKDFPWKKATPEEFLTEGDGFVQAADTKNGKKFTLADIKAQGVEHVMLYYTASWCPPCRNFTPKLIEWYNKINGGGKKKVEIITVSWDKEEPGYSTYCAKMPWLAVPWGDKRLDQSASPVSVNSIPTLALVSVAGGACKIMSESARTNVERDPEAAYFPWVEGIPLPSVNSLENIFDEVIEAFEIRPTVVLNARTSDPTAALKAFGEAKSKLKTSPKNVFFMSTEPCKPRPATNQCSEGHELRLEDGREGSLCCDACSGPAHPSHRCDDCDFDMCQKCFEKEAVPTNRSQDLLSRLCRAASGNVKTDNVGGLELCFFSLIEKKWHVEPVTGISVDELVATIDKGCGVLYPK